MLRHELQLNEISVVIEFSGEGSLVRVVPGQLQQVILNLIKNAIETISYIPPSRRRLSISTRLGGRSSVVYLFWTPELECILKTKTTYLIYSSRPSLSAWDWGPQSAA